MKGNSMKLTLPILSLLLCTTLTGCSAITLKNSWKDPGAPATQYRRLLIVGVTDKIAMRQVFEEIFAAEFRKKGVEAIPSYTLTSIDSKPSRASLEDAVKKSGADGVLTTRVVGLKNDSIDHDEYVITAGGYTNVSFYDDTLYPMDLYGFYTTTLYVGTVGSQSVSVTTSTVATVETNLYDSGTARMVWSGTSSAVNPDGVVTASEKLAGIIIKAMAAAGLI
jgi:hypothetical protein